MSDKILKQLVKKADEPSATLNKVVERLDKLENGQDALLAKTLDIEQYMQSELTTKDELYETKNEVLEHVDGFIKLHNKIDLELVATQSKYKRLENRVKELE